MRVLRLRLEPEERHFAGVLEADVCAYCGGPGGVVDHIVPRRAGGRDEWENFTSACNGCNSRKGPMSLLHALLAFPLMREIGELESDLRVLTSEGWSRGSAH